MRGRAAINCGSTDATFTGALSAELSDKMACGDGVAANSLTDPSATLVASALLGALVANIGPMRNTTTGSPLINVEATGVLLADVAMNGPPSPIARAGVACIGNVKDFSSIAGWLESMGTSIVRACTGFAVATVLAAFMIGRGALAVEAALCGCVVVCMRNPYFEGLLAEAELGMDGFSYGEAPEELARAHATIGQFRASYMRAFERAADALAEFDADTQQIAERVGGRPRVSVPRLGSASAVDWFARKLRRLFVARHQLGTLNTLRLIGKKAGRRLLGRP